MPVGVICVPVAGVPPTVVRVCRNSAELNTTGRAAPPAGISCVSLKANTPLSANPLKALLGMPITTLSVVTSTEVLAIIGIPLMLEKLLGKLVVPIIVYLLS
jgi:hypothetical protein